ncbi:hypothetical protein HN018_26710 (plasmid) [Lichenicola cladoniae]|uniref:Uncharacterized protein n=1 Tax=Lichenicola cladoniae TaxID=1484109 RepID=A0A6M8I025_9PROT|nr:hypothetical protein [Lichenicola cladoniae]NPD66613.1 hypothetical protein [Acetobacteraceae bacterium]QKE93725.1 hypothetical protein HN018_26710 [Lichenicola cladoniae]
MRLPDTRRDAGLSLLGLVDRVGFDAVGAGWGYRDESQSWRFYLFTEMTDTKGPLWVWTRLLKAFSKLNLPAGVTPLDVVIASPDEWLYRTQMVKAEKDPPLYTFITETSDLARSDYGIDRLWLLRANPEMVFVGKDKKKSARRFDMKVRQLMAA